MWGHFFGFFGALWRCGCGSGECGLDLLFAANQAHGHLTTQAEKVIKYVNFGGRFLAALWDSISEPFWRHFWRHFGTILGSKWPKAAVQKAMEKKGRKKSCGCLQVSAGVGGGAPLKHYNIGAPGGHKHPMTTPLVPRRHGGGCHNAPICNNAWLAGWLPGPGAGRNFHFCFLMCQKAVSYTHL